MTNLIHQHIRFYELQDRKSCSRIARKKYFINENNHLEFWITFWFMWTLIYVERSRREKTGREKKVKSPRDLRYYTICGGEEKNSEAWWKEERSAVSGVVSGEPRNLILVIRQSTRQTLPCASASPSVTNRSLHSASRE